MLAARQAHAKTPAVFARTVSAIEAEVSNRNDGPSRRFWFSAARIRDDGLSLRATRGGARTRGLSDGRGL